MKVYHEGHTYCLQNFDNTRAHQVIQFIDKRPVSHDATGKMFTEKDGTTNEEVLSMLIDRMEYLDTKFPSEYNKVCRHHLGAALAALNARTADRKAREVEGLARK